MPDSRRARDLMVRTFVLLLAVWVAAVGGAQDALAAFNAAPVHLSGVPTLVYGNRVEISGEAQKTCVILIAIQGDDDAAEEAYLAIPKQAASEIARFICKQSYPERKLEGPRFAAPSPSSASPRRTCRR